MGDTPATEWRITCLHWYPSDKEFRLVVKEYDPAGRELAKIEVVSKTLSRLAEIVKPTAAINL